MKEDFELLETQILNLSIRWSLENNLFKQNANRADLFEWGGQAWNVLHRCLLESIYMTIGRIMDPATKGKKENASLARLMELRGDGNALDPIKTSVEEIRGIYEETIQPWRNRFFAHRDRETAANPASLPDVPREALEQVVWGLLDTASKLGLEVREIDNNYEVHVLFKEGPGGLMKVVERGIRGIEEDVQKKREQYQQKQ
jgi:hypothetical protein